MKWNRVFRDCMIPSGSYQMNKPIVIDRPWWRHPIFPWGWYSLRRDVSIGEVVAVNGYYHPGDGLAGGSYRRIEKAAEDDNGVVISPPNGGSYYMQWHDSHGDADGGVIIEPRDLDEWSEKGLALVDIKRQPFF